MDSDDGHIAMWMHLLSLDCTLKAKMANFMYILSQLKNRGSKYFY